MTLSSITLILLVIDAALSIVDVGISLTLQFDARIDISRTERPRRLPAAILLVVGH